MGLEKLAIEGPRAWGLWKIEEEERVLHNYLPLPEPVPDNISNPKKRLEWLAGRVLVNAVMQGLGMRYQGIDKDEHGKPFPRGCNYQLSLSHSHPYVAVLMDATHPVGVDLEQPNEKLFRIGPRVLHPQELADAGVDLVKHCIYWCAKEALIKVHGKKDLVLAENLRITPFVRENDGDILGRIIVDGSESVIPLQYRVFPGFVVVFSKQNEL